MIKIKDKLKNILGKSIYFECVSLIASLATEKLVNADSGRHSLPNWF
jgi:hypothetical protein